MEVPKLGVPADHPKLDHFSIEIYGFGDPPIVRNTHMERSQVLFLATALLTATFSRASALDLSY